MKIGKKLKELRTQNGLTLEELANRSELTKGFLSQLERDLTSPNISALENILEALGTNLADFFQSSKEEQIVFHVQDFFVNEQEDYITEYIIPNAQKNQMEPILLTLKPGAKSAQVRECFECRSQNIMGFYTACILNHEERAKWNKKRKS